VLLDTLPAINDYLLSQNMSISKAEMGGKYPDEYACFKNRAHAIECFKGWEQSSYFEQIPPLSGAIDNINKLKNAGFKISIITAVGTLDTTKERRKANLDNVFGENCFEEILFVDWSENKNTILQKFPPTFFIEDTLYNALNTLQTHHQPVLFKNPQNQHLIKANLDELKNVEIVENWDEIFTLLTQKS